MTIEALAGDVIALLDHLGDRRGRSVRFQSRRSGRGRARARRARVGKLPAASATPTAHWAGSAPLDDDRMPTHADF
jgi:hypothetical protein